jgi:hypothetical protein
MSMLNNPALLMWSILFGAFGMGYFVYGKKQRSPVPFVVGIALMVYPYFISNVYVLVLIGAVLLVVPYFVRFD